MAKSKIEQSDKTVRETDAAADRRFAPLRRWLAASLPAAGVTVGLFMAMTVVVSVEAPVAEAVEPRPLVNVMPKFVKHPRTHCRCVIRRLDVAVPPPRLPPIGREFASKASLVISAVDTSSLTPRFGSLKSLALPKAVFERELQPLGQPVVAYPDAPARRGIEGECEVRFSVNMRGQPFDVSATCTDPGFVRAAERAVARSEFAPQIVQGQPVEQHGVVYPITFQLSD